MKGLLTALGAALRAFAGSVIGGAAALARAAGASARVTAAGASALGTLFLLLLKAGAVRAGGGVKKSIFAFPGVVLKTLRGKIVEIAITIAATAGIAYWISDAQVIRSEPIACWLSDKTNELFGATSPLPPDKGFRVLVAQLDADEGGRYTRTVALSLQDVKGLEVRELCGSLGVPKAVPMAEGWRNAEGTARDWLRSWHADVIVWGTPTIETGVRLYITTPTDSGALKTYDISREDGYVLSAKFDEDFAAQVQALVLNGIEVDPQVRVPVKFSDLLVERLPRLRALALMRGKSAEANLSSFMIYVVAFERVLAEDIWRDTTRVVPADALAAVDGFSATLDPERDGENWLQAAILEAQAKLRIYALLDDIAGLERTAALFERVATRPGVDPRIAAIALNGEGQAFDTIARIANAPDAMRKAIALLDEVRRAPLGPDGDVFKIEANVNFAQAVQWLVHETGDTRHLQEAADVAGGAARAIEPGHSLEDVVRHTLLDADLQAQLAIERGDEAALRAAIQRFAPALTEEIHRERRGLYETGLDQRSEARAFLARATLTDEDFRSAIEDASALLKIYTPERNGRAFFDVAQRRAGLLTKWGQVSRDAARVRTALADLNAVLGRFRREDILGSWCALSMSVARAQWALGELGVAADGRVQAIATLKAVEAASRVAAPRAWLDARRERAGMTRDLADVNDDAAATREAVDLYRSALPDAASRAKDPRAWADSQFELGFTLTQLGDIAADANAYRQAAQAFREALSELPREKDDGRWGAVSIMLADALMRQGERAHDRNILAEAQSIAGEVLAARASADPGDVQALRAARTLAFANGAFALVTKDLPLAEKTKAEIKALLDRIDRNSARLDWAWTRLRYGEIALVVGALNGDAAATAEGVGAVIEAREVAVKLEAKPLVRAADAALAKAPSAHRTK